MKFLATILLFTFSLSASAQVDSVFRFERDMGHEIVDFTVDNLGNLYVFGKFNQLKKIGPNGDSIAVFNAIKRYGQLYSIDVTNPLKVLLYYKDFGTIVTLDRFLSIRNTLDLRRFNLFQVKAVGLAYDNNIWVFDEVEGRLKRISEDGKVVEQSTEFRLLFDSLPSPEFISDQDGLVYLYDKQKGAYIFDYYCALKNKIPLTGWADFTVASKAMYGRKEVSFMKYEPGTLDLREVKMPQELLNATRVRIANSRIYVLKDGVLKAYFIRE